MQSLSQVITSLTNTIGNHSQYEGEVRVCEDCGNEIQSIETLPNKFVFPTCQCKMKEYYREKEERKARERIRRIQDRFGKGLIDDELQNASLDNFEPRKGTENALEVAKSFLRDFTDRRYGLYFYGPVGVGKSHLTASIHHELLRRGIPSLFINTSRLFGMIKSTYGRNSKVSDQQLIQSAIDVDVLTLDEIGLTRMTAHEYDLFFQIIDGRKGKITNYSSNLNLEQLMNWFAVSKDGQVLDEHKRLPDRFYGTEIVEINTTSYRVVRAKRGH